MIYVLTYPRFDSETAAAIEGYRAEYEPDRARLVNAHITLVFGLSNAEPAAFKAFCETAASTVRPFPVVFDQCETLFDPVDEVHKICLTCSEGKSDLASLHTALYDGPHRSELRTDSPFRPHMTIATNKDLAVLENLDAKPIGMFPLSAEINAIEIVQISGKDLRCLKTIDLR